jgi:hypothetical protein
MSGHAAYALVVLEDRGQFATQKHYQSGEHLPQVKANLRFPLTVTFHGCQRLWGLVERVRVRG